MAQLRPASKRSTTSDGHPLEAVEGREGREEAADVGAGDAIRRLGRVRRELEVERLRGRRRGERLDVGEREREVDAGRWILLGRVGEEEAVHQARYGLVLALAALLGTVWTMGVSL